jgi:hypothetical protein
MVFAIANKKAVIMKVIVSLLLVFSTVVAIWSAWCMIDFSVYMVCFLQ